MRRGSSAGGAAARHAALLLAATAALLVGRAAADLPPMNPYAGKSYGGCDGNYCHSADEGLELEFWRAADGGDAEAVRGLLASPKLNISRNVVPDDDGLARVLDVAVWAASEKGHHAVMKVLLSHPGVTKMYEYEDGHIIDLAAAKGDAKMVQLLLDFNMTVGPAAMAHAAHFNHTAVMELLLPKPMDLKSAMQAISNGGSPEVAKLLLEAAKKAADPADHQQSHGAYDWHADYVQIAVSSGNVPVLKVLLEAGFVLKWQQAEDFIKVAAEQGSPGVLALLFAQQLFRDDADELDEAVATALKVAAEGGRGEVVDFLLEQHPEQTKKHCKAGIFRATKFGHADIVQRLSALCPVDASKSTKLQDADWLGKLLAAARSGDAGAIAELVKHDKAAARIKKLQTPVDEDSDKPRQGPIIDPKNDPLVLAAGQGHLEAVKHLEQLAGLCPPCAAAAAAKSKHTAVVQHLAKGSGKVLLENFDDVIQNALRVVAYSMEAQNWELVAWMLREHASQDLGAYFLPVIAQEGKLNDMVKMLKILSDLGYDKGNYFRQQVHSAMISAALAGQLDLVLELKQHSAPPDAAIADDYDDGDDAAGGGSKTEL